MTPPLMDLLAARRLMREARYQPPQYILSSGDALNWCRLSDHRLQVCDTCRNDETPAPPSVEEGSR